MKRLPIKEELKKIKDQKTAADAVHAVYAAARDAARAADYTAARDAADAAASAMNYLKEDDAKKSDPVLMTGEEMEFLSTRVGESQNKLTEEEMKELSEVKIDDFIKLSDTTYVIKNYYVAPNGKPAEVYVKLKIHHDTESYSISTNYDNATFNFGNSKDFAKRLAIITAIQKAAEFAREKIVNSKGSI